MKVPFKTVLVKGLGKIKFPGTMSDEAIENAIKNSSEFYSGTMGQPIESVGEIVPFGKSRPGYSENYFGGVFSSRDKEVASSHGDNMQKFLVPNDKIAEHDDIVSDLLYEDDGVDILRNAVSETRYENLSDDELYELAEYVSENK